MKKDKHYNKIMDDYQEINLHGTENWYWEEERRHREKVYREHKNAREANREKLKAKTPPWMFNESPRTEERRRLLEALNRVNNGRATGKLHMWKLVELKNAIVNYLYGYDEDMDTDWNY